MSDKRDKFLESGELSPRDSREPAGNHNGPAGQVEARPDIILCKLKQDELGPNIVENKSMNKTRQPTIAPSLALRARLEGDAGRLVQLAFQKSPATSPTHQSR
jgi:hypothetical protein